MKKLFLFLLLLLPIKTYADIYTDTMDSIIVKIEKSNKKWTPFLNSEIKKFGTDIYDIFNNPVYQDLYESIRDNSGDSIVFDSLLTAFYDVIYNDLIIARTTTWEGDVSNDWNTSGNWDNGVPTNVMQAVIPDLTTITFYPIITSDDNATCYSIKFESNSGVKGLEYLTYIRAYVSIKLQRSRWYTLSAPLKTMYSGDYYAISEPKMFMKLFNNYSPDATGSNVFYDGTFTKSFANLQVPLTQCLGFAYKIDTSYIHYTGPISPYCIRYSINNDTTITFPNLDDDGYPVDTVYPYSGFIGYVYTYLPKPIPKDSILSFRLIAEDSTNTINNITYNISDGENLIGNPMMCHLNIDRFLTDNLILSNYIRTWNGSSYATYDNSTGLWDNSFTGDMIAPMQSFVVGSTTGGDIIFDIDYHFDVTDGSTLRSASISKISYIKILSELDKYKSGTIIINDKNSTNETDSYDIIKLFSGETNCPDIYTSSNLGKLSFNKFNKIPFTVPIGIKSNMSNRVKLTFNSSETFNDDIDIILINTLTGEEINIRENNVYYFDFDNTSYEGTLFLSFRSATSAITDYKLNTNSGIYVFNDKNKVNIISNEFIKIVEIYTIDGKFVNRFTPINSYKFSTTALIKKGIYIIRVTTDTKCISEKILIK